MRGPAFPRRLRAGCLVFRDPFPCCLLLYILLYFDASGFLRLGLLAAALHECGHVLAYLLLCRRLPLIEVSVTGLYMRTGGARLTPGRRFLLAAAGPGMNALLAAVWYARASARLTVWDAAFLAANVLTGAFNLLPVPPLDGAGMLGAAWAAARDARNKLQSAPK